MRSLWLWDLDGGAASVPFSFPGLMIASIWFFWVVCYAGLSGDYASAAVMKSMSSLTGIFFSSHRPARTGTTRLIVSAMRFLSFIV